MFYAVEQWNSWFPAFIYLKNRELWPLQLVLREIIIENNVSDMLTGVDAAEMLAVSESIKYVLNLRMDLATELLRTTDLSQQDIAVRIGYANSGVFLRVFKKKYGITPGTYRKQNQK